MAPALSKEEEKIHPVHKIPNKDLVWVLCEICYEVIAVADITELCLPLETRMFRSPDPLHEALPPFQEGVEFQYMFCPVCRHRFAVEENRIRTNDGMIEIPEKVEEQPGDMTECSGIDKPAEVRWPAMPQVEMHNDEQEATDTTERESQGDADVACQVHTLEAAGSIPVPATNKDTCPVCGKVCKSLSGLQLHMKSHNNAKEEE